MTSAPAPVTLPRANGALRVAATLDVVVASILAYVTLVVGLGNNSFAAIAPILLVALAVVAVLAAPIAQIFAIVALVRSRTHGGRGGSIATIIISAILVLVVLVGAFSLLVFQFGLTTSKP